jgi:hypothetical protein
MNPEEKKVYDQMFYSDQMPAEIYKRDYWSMICLKQTPDQSHRVALASALRSVFMPLKRWSRI